MNTHTLIGGRPAGAPAPQDRGEDRGARGGEDLGALVRDDHVHRRVYTDPAIFKLEMRRLFGRAWIYVGHESQAKAPGAWFTALVGDQSIIVARDEEGALHGLYNRCTHRGPRLCAQESGQGDRLSCPYHGWSFSARGDLLSVPMAQNYNADFRLEDYKLRKVARLDTYRGFIFASLSAEGPGLLDYLGHMRTSIDDLVDRAPEGELEASPVVLKHGYRANWKLTFENLNDTIHAGFAHNASVLASLKVKERYGEESLSPSLKMMLANGKNLKFFQNSEMVTEPFGHSYIGGHIGAKYSAPAMSDYVRQLIAIHGEEKAMKVLAVDRHLMLLYPSSTWHARYQTVRIVRPIAVDYTEVWGYVFKLKGAPPETFINAIEYCNGSTSGFSPVIADDLELYERIAQGNAFGDADWIPMARGVDERFRDDPNETRSPATSEAFIRNQMQAWKHFMSGSFA